jgi:outer membrane protein TolC
MVRSIALCLSLVVASVWTKAADAPQTVGAIALPEPLTAEAFRGAVLARNASLEAMQQASIAAVAQVKPAGALEDPMLSIFAAPRTFGTATGASGGIEVSQPLPWWGTRDARVAVARAEADAASHDVDALRLQLTALAQGAFSDWVYVHRALEVNAANQTVLTELRSTARVRYASGQGLQQDVLQADVQRALLKQQRLEWERQRIVVQARMDALLERPPEAPIPAPAGLPDPSRLPAEELLAQRVLSHPQLQSLEAEERAATAAERLTEKERYPKFGVSAGYNNMWADPAMRPTLGFSMTLPIDQEKYRANLDSARARARRTQATLEDQRVSVLSALAVAYASVQEAGQSLALYRDELVPLARNTLEVARAEYGTGRGEFFAVLTAEQHRLETELGLARAQSLYFQRLAELERASGGPLHAALPTDERATP